MARKVVVFRMMGHEKMLEFSCRKISLAADMIPGLRKNFKEPLYLPTKIRKWTVLRSPHIDKRSRETFERRTHNRIVSIECENLDLASKFITFVKNYALPGQVGCMIFEHTLEPLHSNYTIPPIKKKQPRLKLQKQSESGQGRKENNKEAQSNQTDSNTL